MRYFSMNEYDPEHPEGGYVVTYSEEDIKRDYYPYWHERMVKKFGIDIVNEQYSFADCLDDWVVVHWAWEEDKIV